MHSTETMNNKVAEVKAMWSTLFTEQLEESQFAIWAMKYSLTTVKNGLTELAMKYQKLGGKMDKVWMVRHASAVMHRVAKEQGEAIKLSDKQEKRITELASLVKAVLDLSKESGGVAPPSAQALIAGVDAIAVWRAKQEPTEENIQRSVELGELLFFKYPEFWQALAEEQSDSPERELAKSLLASGRVTEATTFVGLNKMLSEQHGQVQGNDQAKQ